MVGYNDGAMRCNATSVQIFVVVVNFNPLTPQKNVTVKNCIGNF